MLRDSTIAWSRNRKSADIPLIKSEITLRSRLPRLSSAHELLEFLISSKAQSLSALLAASGFA